VRRGLCHCISSSPAEAADIAGNSTSRNPVGARFNSLAGLALPFDRAAVRCYVRVMLKVLDVVQQEPTADSIAEFNRPRLTSG